MRPRGRPPGALNAALRVRLSQRPVRPAAPPARIMPPRPPIAQAGPARAAVPRMRLLELDPRWIHPHVFVFLCPHCRTMLLSCKDVVMSHHEQCELFARELGEHDWNQRIVPMEDRCAWKISSRDFASMSVTPSLDASRAGHWHGHITNGGTC